MEKIALDHREEEKEEVVECVQEETTVTKPTQGHPGNMITTVDTK